MASGSIEKRIEALEAKANSRGARWIVLEANGNVSDDDAVIDALLAPLFCRRHDKVVVVNKFVCTEGLPRVADVTVL